MSKLSVGVDLVEVARVQKLCEKNPRFPKRAFSAQELNYCLPKKNKYQHLAVRWAGKEAVIKALNLKRIALKDISISGNGAPKVEIKNKKAQGFTVEISLTHTEHYALAFAVAYPVCRR